jgi:hypothetical protein
MLAGVWAGFGEIPVKLLAERSPLRWLKAAALVALLQGSFFPVSIYERVAFEYLTDDHDAASFLDCTHG